MKNDKIKSIFFNFFIHKKTLIFNLSIKTKKNNLMQIIKHESGPVSTNMFVVFDEKKEAVIIDAPMDAAQIVSSIINEFKLKVKYLLLTHSHWDHTASAPDIKKITGAKIAINENDHYRLHNPNENSLLHLPFKLESIKADMMLKQGDLIEFGNLKFEVIETPGHTEGGICFVDSINKVIFVGDTLFKGSVGRVDLPGSNGKELLNSIKNKLFNYSDNFTIYSGHGPTTTIGEEKQNNPFVGIGKRGLI